MQLDIDKAIEVMRDCNADSAGYIIEREIDGKKHLIKITIVVQQTSNEKE